MFPENNTISCIICIEVQDLHTQAWKSGHVKFLTNLRSDPHFRCLSVPPLPTLPTFVHISKFKVQRIEFPCLPGRPHLSLQVPVDNVQTHVLGREGWQWPGGNWKISPRIFCIIAISPKCQRSLWSCLTWTSSSFSLAPRLPENTIRPPTCI